MHPEEREWRRYLKSFPKIRDIQPDQAAGTIVALLSSPCWRLVDELVEKGWLPHQEETVRERLKDEPAKDEPEEEVFKLPKFYVPVGVEVVVIYPVGICYDDTGYVMMRKFHKRSDSYVHGSGRAKTLQKAADMAAKMIDQKITAMRKGGAVEQPRYKK